MFQKDTVSKLLVALRCASPRGPIVDSSPPDPPRNLSIVEEVRVAVGVVRAAHEEAAGAAVAVEGAARVTTAMELVAEAIGAAGMAMAGGQQRGMRRRGRLREWRRRRW